MEVPSTCRVLHELRRRLVTVTDILYLTPKMIRVTLKAESLSDFVSLSPDDNVKLFFPVGDGVVARNYTPRRFDRGSGTIIIDFVVHEGGPAAAWVVNASVGDVLEIGGPRKSVVVAPSIRDLLLIGDETALPAIGRTIEEADVRHRIQAVIAVEGANDEQTFYSAAAVEVEWVHRSTSEAHNPGPLLNAIANLRIDTGSLVWIAAEATVARAVRQYLLTVRQFEPRLLRASAYWRRGTADVSEDYA